MRTDTQNLIIIGLVLIGLAFIFKDQFSYASMIGVGLIGFIAPQTLTDKQSADLKQYHIEQAESEQEDET